MQREMDTATIQKLAAETGIQSTWNPLENEACRDCGDCENLYILDDNRTVYCLSCGAEMTMLISGGIDDELGFFESDGYLSSDFAEANKAAEQQLSKQSKTNGAETEIQSQIRSMAEKQTTLPGYSHSYSQSNASPTQQSFAEYKKPFCTHIPTHVIAGRGWGVWAGKKWDIQPYANEFDVVLNLQFDSIREQRIIPIPELQKWEYNANCKYKEIQIDWPDFGISSLPREFWEDLTKYLKEHKSRLLIFCMGGHGRTGTAVASLLVTALGYTAENAIAWVRKNYCFEAIETKSQEQYIAGIERQGKKEKKSKKRAKIETA